MHILLTGPSGFVGARVLEDLQAAGHSITALAHSRSSIAEIQRIAPGCNLLFGDVSYPFETRDILPSGIEAIVYLPGLLREDKRRRQTYQRVHVEGVRNLLNEAKRVGVRRWLQMSALGVGPDKSTRYFHTKWEAEELVRASGMEWTIVRPSYIFDDRPTKRVNFVSELVKVVKAAPIVPVPGDGEYQGQPVSLDDVSQTIVQSLTLPATIGKAYPLGGVERLTYNEVLRTIAGALGLSRTLVHIPLGLMEAVTAVLGILSFFPITAEQLEMLTEGNFVKDTASWEDWQRTFTLPMKRFREGVGKALATEL